MEPDEGLGVGTLDVADCGSPGGPSISERTATVLETRQDEVSNPAPEHSFKKDVVILTIASSLPSGEALESERRWLNLVAAEGFVYEVLHR